MFGVLKPADHARFPLKPLAHFLALDAKDLEGDQPPDRRVESEIEHAHPTLPDAVPDLVASNRARRIVHLSHFNRYYIAMPPPSFREGMQIWEEPT